MGKSSGFIFEALFIYFMLYFTSFVIFLTSIIILTDIVMFPPSLWFIPFIFLFGISFFIFVDWFASFTKEEKEYATNKKEKGTRLLRIKLESKDTLVLLSRNNKLGDYYILLTAILVFIPMLVMHYYANRNWIIEGLFIVSTGSFILLCAKFIFNIKSKKKKFTIDLARSILTIKSYTSNSESYIPLSKIKQIIIKSSKKQNEDKIFYTSYYSIYIEFKDNNALDKIKLIEFSRDKIWTKQLTDKLWYYLNVNILDLSGLKLSRAPFSKPSTKDRQVGETRYSNLFYDKNDNSFIWRTKESNSVLLFEFSLLFLCIESIIYNILFFGLEKNLSILTILSTLIISIIFFLLKNYYNKERFVFKKDNIIYQKLFGNRVINEKKLEIDGVRNPHFLFSNVILSDKNNYIIGDLHSLDKMEINFLKGKWTSLLR